MAPYGPKFDPRLTRDDGTGTRTSKLSDCLSIKYGRKDR